MNHRPTTHDHARIRSAAEASLDAQALRAAGMATDPALPASASLPAGLAARMGSIQNSLAARARAQSATVLFAKGEVTVMDSLSNVEREVVSGDRLAGDVSLKVAAAGGESRAIVRLADGSELWLDAGAELDLAMWSRASELRAVYLVAGRAQAFLAEQARRFVLFLRQGTMVEALGTAFDVTVADGGVTVDVLHGVVRLNHQRGIVRGEVGARLEQMGGDAPTQTTDDLAASRAWWRETMAATGRTRSDLLHGSVVAAACYQAVELDELVAAEPAPADKLPAEPARSDSERTNSARVVDMTSAPAQPVTATRLEKMYMAAATLIVITALVLGTGISMQFADGAATTQPAIDTPNSTAPTGNASTAPAILPRGTGEGRMPMIGAPTIADGNVSLGTPTERVVALSEPAASGNDHFDAANETDWLKRAALDYQGWHAAEQQRDANFDQLSAIAATLPSGPSPAAQALQPDAALANVPQRMPDEVYMKFLHSAPAPR